MHIDLQIVEEGGSESPEPPQRLVALQQELLKQF
jgi:hypothetical protein